MENNNNILLIDYDDRELVLLKKYFKSINTDIYFACNASDALENYKVHKFNLKLVMVSLKMARENEWGVLRQFDDPMMPIVGLIEKENQTLWIKEGQFLGVHAFLAKPLSLLHLKIYLPALLSQLWEHDHLAAANGNRRSRVDRRVTAFGRRWCDELIIANNIETDEELQRTLPDNIKISKAKSCVYCNDKDLKLSPKEYTLFLFLLKNQGCIVSSCEIISQLWPDNSRATEEDVKQYIYRLRKKIGSGSDCNLIIHNHKGFGYYLDPEICVN